MRAGPSRILPCVRDGYSCRPSFLRGLRASRGQGGGSGEAGREAGRKAGRKAGRETGTSAKAVAPAASKDPFHLGTHSYRVTTSVPGAQQAFDRGLTLAYAFSHGAAEREFRKAAELDPKCAMAWWGVALVNGPHINFPFVAPDKAKSRLGRARQGESPRAGSKRDGAGADRRPREALRRAAARGPPPARRGVCRRDARRLEGAPEGRRRRDALRRGGDGSPAVGPLEAGWLAAARDRGDPRDARARRSG